MEKIIKYSDYLVYSLNDQLEKEFLIIEDATFLSNDFQIFKSIVRKSDKIPDNLKDEITKIDFTGDKLEKEFLKESFKIALLRKIPLLNVLLTSKIRYYEDNFIRIKFDEFRSKMNKANFSLKSLK